MQQKTRISYNPFARLDPVRHWNERWQRRQVSRMMAVAVGVVALVVFLFSSAMAQNFEYGAPDDLKGLTKYYIDTEGDIKARNKVVEIVTKELPSLVLTETMEDAQMRLGYKGGVQDAVVGGQIYGNTATVHNKRLPVGSGMVWVDARGNDKTKLRVILNFSSRQDGKLEKMPYEKFAKEFVKVYKKVNGIK